MPKISFSSRSRLVLLLLLVSWTPGNGVGKYGILLGGPSYVRGAKIGVGGCFEMLCVFFYVMEVNGMREGMERNALFGKDGNEDV